MVIAGVCKLFGDCFGFVGPICINGKGKWQGCSFDRDGKLTWIFILSC